MRVTSAFFTQFFLAVGKQRIFISFPKKELKLALVTKVSQKSLSQMVPLHLPSRWEMRHEEKTQFSTFD